MLEGGSEDFSVCLLTSFEDGSAGSDCEFRWFDCLGEVNTNNILIHKKSFLASNETEIFLNNSGTTNCGVQCYIELFGMLWDKGSVLLSNLDMLYRMASQELMELDSSARVSGSFIAHNLKNSSDEKYIQSRRSCVQFWLFLRNYLRSLQENPNYIWLIDQFTPRVRKCILGLRTHLGYLINLPNYVYQHCSNPSGNKCHQPAYHLMHIHLDLRWLHITILYYLAKGKLSNDSIDSVIPSSSYNYKEELVKYIRLLLTELVHLAVMRFEKISDSEVSTKSPFNCTCVQELWLLLQFLTDYMSGENVSQPFWTYLNELIEVLLKQRSIQTIFDDEEIKIIYSDIEISCSRPDIFSLWLVCHLAGLHNFKQLKFGNNKKCDNYSQLEVIVKLIVNDEFPEIEMRKCLIYIEKLCLELWDPRTEPILLLWEYFYKKIDSSFYIPGTTPDNLATVVKSSLALVSRVKSYLDDKNNIANSFQHFLRIIGLHLQMTSGNQKHWNKIKGRVFSKFSPAKMLSLRTIGEYHFSSLFITLSLTADISQVANKMVELVNDSLKMGESLGYEFIKGLLGLSILLVEQNLDLRKIILPLVLHLNSLDCTENLDLFRLFVESIQDILDCNDSLDLGQHIFIDNWVGKFISSTSSISDVTRILDVLLLIVSKLYRKVLIQQSQDQEIIMMTEKLWEQLRYYLNTATSLPSSPYQISDLTANIAALFYKLSNVSRFREIFDMFTCSESTDIKLLRRFICQMIDHESIKSVLIKFDKAIIKAWVRCCIICPDTRHTEMVVITEFVSKLPEVNCISSDLVCNMPQSDEPFLLFLAALQFNYSSVKNIYEKQTLREKLGWYMDGIELWLKSILIPPRSADLVERVYFVVGSMFHLISPLLYVKSKPNSLLQKLTDLMLLPVSVRNPDVNLHSSVKSGIRKTLHLFIEGLVKLDPESDNYISRILRELIQVYLPRCVQPGIHSGTGMSFKLITEFHKFDARTKTIVLQTVCNNFIKRKSRKPQAHSFNALLFIRELAQVHCHSEEVILHIITDTMDRIFDILILYEERSPEINLASSVLKAILKNTIVNASFNAKKSLIMAFSNLCKDHLAWSSRQLFDLMDNISSQAPQIVVEFLPHFQGFIKELEDKRGVGYDKNLRLGLDRIQMKLKL